jgi:hypothetical protein
MGRVGALARVRYSDSKEAARVAADAGVTQIQLSESRFGGIPWRRRKGQHPSGREEELVKATNGFYQGDRGAVSTPSIPIARVMGAKSVP